VGNNKLTVVKITGEAFRQTEDRLLIPIQKGDLIPEGEIIIVGDCTLFGTGIRMVPWTSKPMNA